MSFYLNLPWGDEDPLFRCWNRKWVLRTVYDLQSSKWQDKVTTPDHVLSSSLHEDASVHEKTTEPQLVPQEPQPPPASRHSFYLLGNIKCPNSLCSTPGSLHRRRLFHCVFSSNCFCSSPEIKRLSRPLVSPHMFYFWILYCDGWHHFFFLLLLVFVVTAPETRLHLHIWTHSDLVHTFVQYIWFLIVPLWWFHSLIIVFVLRHLNRWREETLCG